MTWLKLICISQDSVKNQEDLLKFYIIDNVRAAPICYFRSIVRVTLTKTSPMCIYLQIKFLDIVSVEARLNFRKLTSPNGFLGRAVWTNFPVFVSLLSERNCG